MRVWGIADLHLSQAAPGDRSVLAARWKEHAARIAQAWEQAVEPTDLVLLPGDLSMARNHRDLQPDLEWIARRPGLKVLTPGNHDAWWNRLDRVQSMFRPGMLAVQGTAVRVGEAIVCGTRGCAAEAENQQAAATELELLDRALAQAGELRTEGQPLYVLWHFPPFDRTGLAGPAVQRLIDARATCCVYGHLHQLGQWGSVVQGLRDGVRYACVAADAIGFRPIRLDLPTSTPRR